MTKAELIAKCDEAAIPFAPITRPEDLFDDPQLNDGGSLLDVQLADGRSTKLPRLPMMIEDEDLDLRMEAPRIGEHTGALLRELGYSSDDVQRLAANDIASSSDAYA